MAIGRWGMARQAALREAYTMKFAKTTVSLLSVCLSHFCHVTRKSGTINGVVQVWQGYNKNTKA